VFDVGRMNAWVFVVPLWFWAQSFRNPFFLVWLQRFRPFWGVYVSFCRRLSPRGGIQCSDSAA
jgi:hypothetical protein